MLVGLAVGIRPAGYVVARIHASAVHTGEDVIAVVVGGTLVLRYDDAGTAAAIRITHCSLWTLANMVALGVDAVGAVSARIIRALVHVDAAVLRVTFVTSLAHAPWWIARCALRVDTAWESVARIW